MRLLIVTPALGTSLGGGERYALSLLRVLEQAGHQLTILTSLARREEDFWQGTSDPSPIPFKLKAKSIQLPIPAYPGGQQALFRKRRLLALSGPLPLKLNPWLPAHAISFPLLTGLDEQLAGLAPDFDLVHAFNLSWESPLLSASRYAANHQLPLIVTPFAHANSRFGRWMQQMSHQRQLMQQATRIQALSAAEVEGLHKWGIARSKIDLIGMGLDEPPAGPPAQSQFNLPTNYALFVGRASRDKGVDQAIKAIIELTGDEALHLVLAGNLDPEISQQINTLPADKRHLIHPLGRVTEAEKHHLFSQALLFLLPSRSDAFGIVILEAWLHRLPVVAARAGGIPGVIDHDENGLLVPYGESEPLRLAIQQLVDDPTLRQKLGLAGQRKLQREFSWTIVKERLETSYNAAFS